MTPSEALYSAARSTFGLIVRGASAKALRAARSAGVARDPALSEIAILGPDAEDRVWLVRKDVVRTTLHVSPAQRDVPDVPDVS
jgi:hypothetical protein